MKELILAIARALVDAPESLSVREVHGCQTTVFQLQVAKSDLGKVIGKSGRNAEAMRVILSAVSAKEKKRAVIEIIESDDMQTDIRRFHNPSPVEIEIVYRPHRKSA